MKSEFVIQLWEKMAHVLHDDECSAIHPWIWRLPNLKPVFKLSTMKKIFIY